MYKSLLLELTRKRGLHPKFVTKIHMKLFTSSVEIADKIFEGEPTPTKKLAESSAAKVAYTAMEQFKNTGDLADQNTTKGCSLGPIMEKHQLTKSIPSSNSVDLPDKKSNAVSPPLAKVVECPQLKKPIKAYCNQTEEKDVAMDVGGSKGNISAVSGELVTNNYKAIVAEEKDVAIDVNGFKGKLSMDLGDYSMKNRDLLETPDPDSDAHVKRAKLSHPENVEVGDQLQSSSKDAAAKSNSSISSALNQPTMNPFLELKRQAGETVTLSFDKIAIYPRVPNLEFPDDGSITILPFHNDKWVAVGVIEKK